jgi:hypothetical protein
MARIIPVAELAAMEDGEPIMAVRGVLTKVYPPFEGDNDNGHWSFQKAMFKDKTGTAQVKFKDQPDRRHYQGKEVLLQCIKTEKGSFTGVKVKDDEYQGKTTRLIWVTPSADIGLAEEGANGAAAQPPAPQQTPVTPAPVSQTSAPQKPTPAANSQTPAVDLQASAGPQQQAPAPQPPLAAALQAEAQQRTNGGEQRPAPIVNGSREAAVEVLGWANQIANIQLLAITRVEKYLAPMVKATLGIQLDSGERHAWAMNLAMQLEIAEKAMWKMPLTEYAMPKANGQHGNGGAQQPATVGAGAAPGNGGGGQLPYEPGCEG